MSPPRRVFAIALPGAIVTTLALGVFVALQLIENAMFLDRTFYIAVSLLMLVLIVDQARVLRRAREAEEQARRRATMLELELLRRRIAPHFLMNTLNALAEWVESDPKTGVKMIEALAEEFRLLSQISDRPLIPLARGDRPLPPPSRSHVLSRRPRPSRWRRATSTRPPKFRPACSTR